MNKIATAAVFLVLPSLIAAPGCGGDDSNTMAPTLTELQAEIFTPTCALVSCHGNTMNRNTPLSKPLDMRDAEKSHAGLVGVDTFWHAAGTKKRVVAGDPDAGFLIEKLISNTPQPTGMLKEGYMNVRMPEDCMLDNSCLSDAAVEKIRKWIKAGALRN